MMVLAIMDDGDEGFGRMETKDWEGSLSYRRDLKMGNHGEVETPLQLGHGLEWEKESKSGP